MIAKEVPLSIRSLLTAPTALALVLTLANAVKPAVVDDAAYLAFAGQLAEHPLDPYGGMLFWYSEPQPTNEILLPPVVPYWLALGRAIVGSDVILLKLWMFPFALLLAHSLAILLRRFSEPIARPLLASVMLGPAVLPMVNVMLDIPALALGLSSIAVVALSGERRSLGLAIVAGILAALAARSTSCISTVPVILFLYSVFLGRWWCGLTAVIVAVGGFVGWEAWLTAKYGVGHFMFHFREQQGYTAYLMEREIPNATSIEKVWFVIETKFRLFQPLMGYVGWLGFGVGLSAALAVRIPRVVIGLGVMASAAGFVAVCITPWSEGVLVVDPETRVAKLDLAEAVFVTFGSIIGFLVVASLAPLLIERTDTHSYRLRRDPIAWFLAAWFLVELAAYFILTPFPGGRRVISLVVVGTVLTGRVVDYRIRAGSEWLLPTVSLSAAATIVTGLMLYCVDTWDAMPEKAGPEAAVRTIGEQGTATLWFQGHWGFQYYCESAGMKLVDPGRSTLHEGDWLLVPKLPDEYGFYRPYHGGATFKIDRDAATLVGQWNWDDRLAAQTIPNLYGGNVPVTGRDNPRLSLELYRVHQDWIPTRP